MKKVLITRRIPKIAQQLLSKHFAVHAIEENKSYSSEKLKQAVQEYDAILSTVTEKFPAELLKDAKVKVISNYAVGLDNIDLEAARENGIAVYNTPDVVTNSTADMTLALLLALTRKAHESHSYIKEGKWTGWDPEIFLGEEFEGKTFGIIGFGRIGKAVAKRALGFGMKVIFHDKNKIELKECRQVELDHLLNNSDYISIHVSLNQETRNLIDKEKIKKMEKKPIILNLARGPVLDTEALVEGLKTGQVRGACLDVTNPEPLPSEHELCSMNNCIITPHIGTATEECRYSVAKLAAENIINHFSLN